MKVLKIAIICLLVSLLPVQAQASVHISDREIDDDLFRALDSNVGAARIEEILKKGANPDAASHWNMNSINVGETAWLLALERSSPDVIALISKYRKSRSALSPSAQAHAFSIAMSTTQTRNPNYSLERLSLLLSYGLDVNAINLEDMTNKAQSVSDSQSALMIATGKDREDFVKFFLDHGANVNLKTRTGETALFFAKSPAIEALLLRAGADAGAVGQYGRTALSEAIMNGRADVVSVLLDKGGDLKKQKAAEALLLACRVMRQTTNKTAAENSPAIVKALLDHGVDPNAAVVVEGRFSDTPLFEAVRANNAAAVRLLLAKGADPAKVHNGDGTLLELAVQQEDPDITRLLWPRYAPLSAQDQGKLREVVARYGKPKPLAVLAELGFKLSGSTVPSGQDNIAVQGLINAVEQSDTAMIEGLLRQGTDINASGYNQTALTKAVGNVAVMAKPEEPLPEKYMAIVRFLIEHGADVNRADKTGMTPLGTAISNGNLKLYQYLRDKKANPVSSGSSQPYLHLAVSGLYSYHPDGAEKILSDLIKAGNNVDEIDSSGTTPLWQLAEFGDDAKAATILLQNGATVDWVPPQCKNHVPMKSRAPLGKKPEKPNPESEASNRMFLDPEMVLAGQCQTPLSLAASQGRKEVAKALLNAGAMINWQSPINGVTPLMQAAAFGDPEMVSLLLQKSADRSLRDGAGETAADIAKGRENTKALALLEKN